MKRRFIPIFLTILMLFTSIIPSTSFAKELDGSEITDISMDTNKFDQWQTSQVTVNFELPNGGVRAGDTTRIELPKELLYVSTPREFDVNDASGAKVATARVADDNKSIVLEYTDFVENNSDVKGNIYFEAKVDLTQVDEKVSKPINFTVNGKAFTQDFEWEGLIAPAPRNLQKVSWNNPDEESPEGYPLRTYQIFVNRKGQNIENGKVKDILVTEGTELKKDSLKVRKGTWELVRTERKYDYELHNPVDVDYTYTPSEDGRSFEVSFGSLRAEEGLEITYDVILKGPFEDGQVIENKATLTGDQIETVPTDGSYKYYAAGGSGQGSVYKIEILKTDNEGNPLQGAKFKLVRDSDGEVIGELTTDKEGKISKGGLLKASYTLTEIDAPEGYKLDPAERKINVTDFDTRKIATVKVENEKLIEKVSIPVSKVWEGEEKEQATVHLMVGEEVKDTVVLNADNGWKHTFEGLDKTTEDGTEIKYTVKEDEIEGYTATIERVDENDLSKGFTITNKENPYIIPTTEVTVSKKWLDSEGDETGTTVSEIEVELYKNGEATGTTKKLNKDNNWSAKFEELPLHESKENQTPFVYTVKEVGEKDNVVNIDDTEFAVSYDGDMENGFTVTNKEKPHIIPTTEVTVNKKWLDSEGNSAEAKVDEVEVELYKNGEATGTTKKLNKDNNWSAKFLSLIHI